MLLLPSMQADALGFAGGSSVIGGISITAPVLDWDGITDTRTPGFFIDLVVDGIGAVLVGDILVTAYRVNGAGGGLTEYNRHTITSGDLIAITINDTGVTQVPAGSLLDFYSWVERGATIGSVSAVESVGPLTDIAPIFTSATTTNVDENATLSFNVITNEPCTLAITGGADSARFEVVSGGVANTSHVLRWLSNGTKDYEAPNDADTNNVYVVQVTATDSNSLTTAQTISVTVNDVADTSFDPVSLFAGGEKGFIYDPSILASMFQNSNGTGAVASDGDPIGRINDQSGTSNFATNGTSANRPLYKTSGGKQWMEFDGSNDSLACTLSNMSNNASGLTIVACVDLTADGANAAVYSSLTGGGTARAVVQAGGTGGAQLSMTGRRLDADSSATTSGGTATGGARTLIGVFDWANSDMLGYVDNSIVVNNTSFQTSGNTSATDGSIVVGARAGADFLLGKIYWIMAINRALTPTERLNVHTYARAKGP